MKNTPVNGSADVLIIGAGASGSVAARRVAEAGLQVVCLEQGRWFAASEFPGDKPEWELLAGKQWHPNPNVRGRPEDYPVETSDSDIMALMHNGVGGSTIHWGAHWMRFLPSDFRARSLDGIGLDWPFTYEDLVPYYQRLEVEMGVGGLGGDPAYPPGNPPPLPGIPIGKMGRKAAEGMNKLGWHWWPSILAMPPAKYRNQEQCVRRGTCLTGCPDGAKASMDITHWPDALNHGARLVTGARVREVVVGDRGLATGAVYVDRDGNEHVQEASVVILAANGVGTARLLLLSKSKRFPEGLANSSGLVGRNLMIHPYARVTGLYDEDLESWLGPGGGPIRSLEFAQTDPSRGFVRGASWVALPTGGPLSMLGRYVVRPREEVWGRSIHEIMKSVGHAIEWGIMPEDLPDEGNYLTLDPVLTDSDGIPAPKMYYKVSKNTRNLLAFQCARAQEAHEASGAVSVIVEPLVPEATGHLLGTARMGDDPEASVVDEYGRAHDVPNLFIIDGSVFPTASALPPTPTICAFALRSVEHLLRQASLQEVPA